MEMNWVLGVVIVAAIVGVVIIVCEYMNRPKVPKDSDLRSENEILKGKVAGLTIEIEIWKERGTKYSANADAAYARADKAYDKADQMLAAFTKMVSGATEIENLKALLNRLTDDKKTNNHGN